MDKSLLTDEVNIYDWIMAEMAEQATWPVDIIPHWHPRNEGEEGGGDNGNGTGGEAGGKGGEDGDKGGNGTNAQAAVDAAYAKLREAEKDRDRLAAENKKLNRAGLDDLERTKQELEDERLQSAALQEKLDEADRNKDIIELAKTLKFKKPDKALRFVGKDSKDAKAIKTDLKEALEDFPELAGEPVPPPPVNDSGKNTNGKGNNARMNSVIRKMAGRS